METLTPKQIDDGLIGLDGWSYRDDAIHRVLEYETFRDAVDFVNRVADLADSANHHPTITNSYTTVGLSLSTHSAGGVTSRDLDLAARIDEVV